jgi:hypothetical protein
LPRGPAEQFADGSATVVELPLFDVSYTIEDGDIPLRGDYIELTEKTGIFLKAFMANKLNTSGSTILVDFVTEFNSSAVASDKPTTVKYRSTGIFDSSSSMFPTQNVLEGLLRAAFTGENLMEYITALQELPGQNTFSFTVGVCFNCEVSGGDSSVPQSSGSSSAGAIAAAAAGVFILSLSVFVVKRRRDAILKKRDADTPSKLTGMTVGEGTIAETEASDGSSRDRQCHRPENDEEEGFGYSGSRKNWPIVVSGSTEDSVYTDTNRNHDEDSVSSNNLPVEGRQSFESSGSFPSVQQMPDGSHSSGEDHSEDERSAQSLHSQETRESRGRKRRNKLRPWQRRPPTTRYARGISSNKESAEEEKGHESAKRQERETCPLLEESEDRSTFAEIRPSESLSISQDVKNDLENAGLLQSKSYGEEESLEDYDSESSEVEEEADHGRLQAKAVRREQELKLEEDKRELEGRVKAQEELRRAEQKQIEDEKFNLEERLKKEMLTRITEEKSLEQERLAAEQARLKAETAVREADCLRADEERRISAEREALESHLKREEAIRTAEEKRLAQAIAYLEGRVEKERLGRLEEEKVIAEEKKSADHAVRLTEEETRVAERKRIEEKRKLEEAKAALDELKVMQEEHILRRKLQAEEEARRVEEIRRLCERNVEGKKRMLEEKIKAQEEQRRAEGRQPQKPTRTPTGIEGNAQEDGESSSRVSEQNTEELDRIIPMKKVRSVSGLTKPWTNNSSENEGVQEESEQSGHAAKQAAFIAPWGDGRGETKDHSGEKKYTGQGRLGVDDKGEKEYGRDIDQKERLYRVAKSVNQLGSAENDAPWWLPYADNDEEPYSHLSRSSVQLRHYSRGQDSGSGSEEEDSDNVSASTGSKTDGSSRSSYFTSILPR